MSFKGKGNQLAGRIIDLSTGSTNIVITASDSANTYPEGYVGLLVAASQAAPDPFAVNPYVTFDNFYADTAEPTLEYSTDGAGHAVLKWPATLASIWTLQSSSSLAPTATWTEIPASDGTERSLLLQPRNRAEFLHKFACDFGLDAHVLPPAAARPACLPVGKPKLN